MTDFNSAVFWPELAAAGMLCEASTILPGAVSATAFMVDFRRPDVNPITGMQSADYEIEFQYDDVPTLAEDAEVIVKHPTGDVLYRVRKAPEVRIDRGADGFFRCAYLTRVDDCPS